MEKVREKSGLLEFYDEDEAKKALLREQFLKKKLGNKDQDQPVEKAVEV